MPSLPYTGDGSEYDVVVGGVPFRLATSGDLPQSIESLDVSKDQFDAEVDPGEQSLAGFWRRSQSSFHRGAGYLYEPNATNEDFAGFYDSFGLDVWTPGRVTFLRKLVELPTPTNLVRVIQRHGRILGIGTDGDTYEYDDGGTNQFGLIFAGPAGANFTDITFNGANVFGVTDVLRIQSFSPGGTDNGYWLLSTGGPTVTDVKLGFAKYRDWAYGSRCIWQPDLSGTPDNGATPIAPFFTNPQPYWEYTAMAEGPSAVYFAGHDGQESSIQMITIEADGGLPTLSGAITAAVMPSGELITHLAMVAGQYVGIGTTLGFRVGQVEASGTITYGPLILDNRFLDGDADPFFKGVSALTSMGDSFLVSMSDYARAYRVPTSSEIAPLVFPYARDIELAGMGALDSVTDLCTQYGSGFIGLPCPIMLYNGNVYRQHASQFVDEGWLQTSRIRFRTTESKAFKYANVDIDELPILNGAWARVDVITDDDTTVTGSVMDTAAETEQAITLPTDPQSHLSLKFFFDSGTGGASMKFLSYLVRALPAAKPQRLITLPLLCFDSETSRSGQTYTASGWARERLEALQAYEDETATVTYTRGENTASRSCVVDSIRFVQTSPPVPVGEEGAGGILLLRLRTVDA